MTEPSPTPPRPVEPGSLTRPRLGRKPNAPEPAPPWRVEGLPKGQGPGGGAGTPPDGPSWLRRRRWWVVLAILFVVNWIVSGLFLSPAGRTQVSYTFFTQQIQANNVEEITSTADTIQGDFKTKVPYPAGSSSPTQVSHFSTQRPSFAGDKLLSQLTDHNVIVNAKSPDQPAPLWEQLLAGFGPTLLLVGVSVWWFRRASSGGGIGGLGRSRAKLYQPEAGPRTTFEDVAGIDEVENEVAEIVDFLRDPERFRRLGAQIPRGVLLSGQPGTGKTLLARAVAGEAGAPFFSMSASEFVEMIVGVGASRVRDLFAQAKKVAPAIIFIDELDAIGRARGGSASIGGHDEREQTLNQILTEMDGFTGSEGVIVLAATNRPEILDAALLRPGRFDRRVMVSPPDLTGRRAILEVHTRNVPLADDVNLDAIAGSTPGMVGADLKNLVNEAALSAARRNYLSVTAADFSDSLEKILLGTARGIMLSSEEKERTAFHESGHAVLGMLTPGADPVRKVTIIPRGQALGVTFQSPTADRYGYSAEYLYGRIVGALGGRAAEQIIYGDVTTGAESDLEQATNIARQMVGRWGMSEAIGPVSVLPGPGQENPFGMSKVAPATEELIDAEVRRILEQCYERAVRILNENRHHLDSLARTLIERETLDEIDAYAAAGIPRDARPLGDPLLSNGVASGD